MSQTTASIIIPTRNRGPALGRCLEALTQQETNGCVPEIIVVDDCSTDETRAIVQQWASKVRLAIELVSQPRPYGANAARNVGLDRAKGEVILFLDDDVLVSDRWFRNMIDGLQRANCPVVSGPIRLVAQGPIVGKHRTEIAAILGEVLTAATGFAGEVVPVACNMAAFRSVFDRARFDETVRPPVEEVDWLQRTGVSSGFVEEAWVWHCKAERELRLRSILRGAWNRGGESGWWIRERIKMPLKQRLSLALKATKLSARALGHGVTRLCWGGVVIGVGELSKAISLVGLTSRGDRKAENWR